MENVRSGAQQTGATRQLLSLNPNTGERLGSVPISSHADVITAMQRARAAQPAWASLRLKQRMQVMQRVQERLVDHAAEIATLVSQEMGKSEVDSLLGDVLLSLNTLSGYLKLAPEALRTQRLRHGLLHFTKRSYLVREPVGVVGVVSPFNFPVLTSGQAIFAALIAGNAVVHKPSEFTPLTALRIRALCVNAGLPEDLFQVVIGDGKTGKQLIHAGVDHIAFVGGSVTGRKIAAAAGRQLIPTTLELGGANAMIVLDDAPLGRAADAALSYAFAANGEMCGAINCVYVTDAIAAAFEAQLVARSKKWRTSNDTRPGGGDVTALLNFAALERIEQYVQEAEAAGARVLFGGQRLANVDAPVYLPTLVADATPDMRIVQEETFGPLLSVLPIAHEREAVTMINDSPFGLTASVWTRDGRRAWQVARQLQVATVAVNDHLWPFFAVDVPWGGIKASGMGRTGGFHGLQAMTYAKVISYDRLNLPREVYWYPRPVWLYSVLLLLISLLYSQQPRKRLRALWQLITRHARG